MGGRCQSKLVVQFASLLPGSCLGLSTLVVGNQCLGTNTKWCCVHTLSIRYVTVYIFTPFLLSGTYFLDPSQLNWQTTNNIATKLTNQINNQSIIPWTDVVQLALTLTMTTAQVVEMSVTVNNNSRIQDYVHPDNQTQPTFTIIVIIIIIFFLFTLDQSLICLFVFVYQ